jgi:hypothetical protein
MTADFTIVFELLERHISEVGGRAALNISSEIREKLVKLAAGMCNENQRQELIRLLTERSDLLPVLAQEIKKMRTLAP